MGSLSSIQPYGGGGAFTDIVTSDIEGIGVQLEGEESEKETEREARGHGKHPAEAGELDLFRFHGSFSF